MECIGFPLAGLNCLMMLGSAAVSVVAGLFGAAVAGTSVFGVMTLASFGVGLAGFVKRSRAKRYKQYVQKLTGKDYCAIDDLAAAVGRKRKYVLKDLQDMIDRRFFPEGRFDEKKTTFLGTNAMYQQYLLAQESMKQREEREARKKAEEEKIYSNPHMTFGVVPIVTRVTTPAESKLVPRCTPEEMYERLSADLSEAASLLPSSRSREKGR